MAVFEQLIKQKRIPKKRRFKKAKTDNAKQNGKGGIK
jgi:hypothetical protein